MSLRVPVTLRPVRPEEPEGAGPPFLGAGTEVPPDRCLSAGSASSAPPLPLSSCRQLLYALAASDSSSA